MKSSRFALGLVGLVLAGLWYFAGGSQPWVSSNAAETPQRVAAPLTHENLSVYFIHGSDTVPDAKVLTLQEALERELAVVHETSNVNVLAVENRSPDYELFIQSGDIVKGGKQDRMAATDMLLSPNSGVVPLPAHCVEQGRWTGRGSEDARQFKSSYQCAAGKELKYANVTGQQAAVWHNVSTNQSKLNENLKTRVNADASPTSFQLTLEAPAVKAKVAEYEAALKAGGEDRENIIGVVFVVNGQVTGAEVYGSNALFRKAWPKLLNSAAVEAVAEFTDKFTAVPPSTREVEQFLARGADPEPAGAADELLPFAPPYERENQRRLARVAIANGEIYQTEGRAPQTEGRALQELNRASLSAPAVASAPGTVSVTYSVPNVPNADRVGRIIIEGNEVTRDRAILNQLDLRPVQAAALANPVGVPGTFIGGGVPAGAVGSGATHIQPPVNPDGNRLSSNRAENNSTLLVESRDPARKNAIIHKSYINK